MTTPEDKGFYPIDRDLDDEEMGAYYTPSSSKKQGRFSSFFKIAEMPLIFLGIGILFIIIVFAVMAPGTSKDADEITSDPGGRHQETIEALTADVHSLKERMEDVENEKNNLKAAVEHYQRKEAALVLKTARLSEKIDELEKTVAGMMKGRQATRETARKETQKVTKVKSPSVKTAKKSPKKIHTVKSKETFYSISRKYGISVSKLLEMNKLTEKSIIHPGDRLIVGL